MYGVVISAPLFVTTNVAVPAFEVHAPVAVKTGGGGGGGTQRDIFATEVNPASLGLDSVYDVDEPVTVMVVLAPAANWKVLVSTGAPLASVTL